MLQDNILYLDIDYDMMRTHINTPIDITKII